MGHTPSLLCALIAVIVLPSCVSHHRQHEGGMPPNAVLRRSGPPPHAPAHGYRHKHHHHGVEMVFDAGLGAYVVVGWEDVFFLGDHFYRLNQAGWEISLRLDGGWTSIDTHRLPRGLGKQAHKAKRHRGRHGPPAKHRH